MNIMNNNCLPKDRTIELIKILHCTLQTDKNLRYKVDYWCDINAVYKGDICLVWYGGLQVTHWEFPELIRIHPCLLGQISKDVNCPIRVFDNTMVRTDDFGSISYDRDHNVATAGIPKKEYNLIKAEMDSIRKSKEQSINTIITGLLSRKI